LKEWSDVIVGQLRQSFETYAESYRAQAERALGGRVLDTEELAEIRENLLQLGGGAAPGKDIPNSEHADASHAPEASAKTV
jgi:hypothetical protein